MSSTSPDSLPHRPPDPAAEPDPPGRRAGRYAFSVAIGATVTMGVLFLMQGLIATANRKLNESGQIKELPVIIVSSAGSEPRVQMLKELGVRDYIQKPFTPERLQAAIAEVAPTANPLLT